MPTDAHAISFVPVSAQHDPLIAAWLRAPHRRAWWGDPDEELGFIRDMVEGRDVWWHDLVEGQHQVARAVPEAVAFRHLAHGRADGRDLRGVTSQRRLIALPALDAAVHPVLPRRASVRMVARSAG